MLKPTVISRSYNCAPVELKGQSIVECRFPQPSEITRVIAVSPQVSCSSVTANSGKADYGGRLVLSVVYSDEAGKLCRIQKGAEFSHSLEDERITPSMTCLCRLSCEKITTRREGSSYVVSAVIGAGICAFERRERTYITAAEGAFLNLKNVAFCSVVPFSGESEEEDSFDMDGVDDVLIPSARAEVQSVVCGTGEVEISGEIYLSLLAMRGDVPATLERIIAYRAVIPCEDSSASCRAAADVQITQLSVTATVNEERGKCEAAVTCALSFTGKLIVRTEENVATDAFSADAELSSEYAEETCEECVDIKCFSERISALAASKAKLGYDCRFLTVALPEAECYYNYDTACAEGEVRATLLYEQEGEIRSTQFSLPFAQKLGGMEEGCEVALSVAVCGVGIRLRAEGETEADATLRISASLSRKRSVKYICALSEKGAKQPSSAALSVCFPCKGDDMWDVAKKLNASPEEVSALNPDIACPLTGSERIIIYRARKKA